MFSLRIKLWAIYKILYKSEILLIHEFLDITNNVFFFISEVVKKQYWKNTNGVEKMVRYNKKIRRREGRPNFLDEVWKIGIFEDVIAVWEFNKFIHTITKDASFLNIKIFRRVENLSFFFWMLSIFPFEKLVQNLYVNRKIYVKATVKSKIFIFSL